MKPKIFQLPISTLSNVKLAFASKCYLFPSCIRFLNYFTFFFLGLTSAIFTKSGFVIFIPYYFLNFTALQFVFLGQFNLFLLVNLTFYAIGK